MEYTKPINAIEMIPEAYVAGFSEVHKYTRGDGIVVAYLGTGVRSHYDLNNQILAGKNFTTDNGGDPLNYAEGGTSYRGSTFVSVLCAEQNMNPDGTSPTNLGEEKMGVAPNAKIIVGKTALNDGTRPVANHIAGLRWALDFVGPNNEKVDIIVYNCRTVQENLEIKALIDEATSKGIIVIVPDDSGDSSTTVYPYPSVYPNVITVGGVNDNGALTTQGNSNNTFVVPNTYWGLKYMSASFPAVWYKDTIGHVERPLAFGAGAIALMLQAYKEAETPITNGAHLKTELPKYLVPATNNHTGNHAVKSGMGRLDFYKTPLPNVPTATIVYSPPEVKPNLTKPVVTVGTVTYNNVALSWNYTVGENDNVLYQVKRDDKVIETVGSLSYTDRSAVGSTTYSYTIAVINKDGQLTESNPVSVTTAQAPPPETKIEYVPVEPEPPIANTTPPVLKLGVIGHDGVQLLWTYTPAENDEVTYEIKRNGQLMGETITKQSYLDRAGVFGLSNYIYTVSVKTESGVVVQSNQLSVTTPAEPPVEKEIEYVPQPYPVPGPTEYVYVPTGSGGTSLTFSETNDVVKADYGRNAYLAKRYAK